MKISSKAKLRSLLSFVLLYMIASHVWWNYSLIEYGIQEQKDLDSIVKLKSINIEGEISHKLVQGLFKGNPDITLQARNRQIFADSQLIKNYVEEQHPDFTIQFINSQKIDKFDTVFLKRSEAIKSARKFEKRKTAWLLEGITAGAIIFVIILGMYWFLDRMITLNMQQNNFLLAVTHELKTPVASAKLAIQTAQKQSGDNGSMLELANKNLNRLASLMDNVLMATRLESHTWKTHKEAIELKDLVNITLAEIKSSLPTTARIKTVFETNLTITGEIDMLKMALSNLIHNAIKYSEKDNEEIVLRSLVIRGRVALQVEDFGIGIPQNERRKIFQKFYRIGDEQTRMSSGSGLGLYLVYKILRQHSAIISVEDNQPKGTIFKIVFENKV